MSGIIYIPLGATNTVAILNYNLALIDVSSGAGSGFSLVEIIAPGVLTPGTIYDTGLISPANGYVKNILWTKDGDPTTEDVTIQVQTGNAGSPTNYKQVTLLNGNNASSNPGLGTAYPVLIGDHFYIQVISGTFKGSKIALYIS